MGTADKTPRPAYVVDIDEQTQKPVRGTGRSATTKEKELSRSHRESRSRKKSDTEALRSERPIIRNLESPLRRSFTEDYEERNVTVERRKSSSGGPRRASSRQPSTRESHPLSRDTLRERTSKRDESVYYGVGVPMQPRAAPILSQPIPMRPRPQLATTTYARPASYHATYPANFGSRPPLSTSAFYQGPPSVPAPSYPPPPTPGGYVNYAASPVDYFTRPVSTQPTRSLSERFTPAERSASAFGDRPLLTNHPHSSSYDDYDDEDDEDDDNEEYDSPVESPKRIVRRASIRPSSARPAPPRKTKEEKDYELMPPPPPPSLLPKPILRRPSVDIPGSYPSESPRASPVPRASPARRSSPAPRESRTIYREEPSRPRRQRPKRSSVSYNLDRDDVRYQLETATSKPGRPRRQSYYGQSASTESSGGYEDKIREASMYQEDVTGGPGLALTAELLKRQQRRQAGSSRSTKSSGSHDESDFRRSATTRTTRSGSGVEDGNVTIKVLGSAKLVVDGTQIECLEGGEIQIQRQNSLRNGSERSSYSEYGPPRIEDRQSQRSGQSSRHSYALEHPMENYI
ncbi:hypothetical protein B7463_g5246, partial [Scytalidium lignicola]